MCFRQPHKSTHHNTRLSTTWHGTVIQERPEEVTLAEMCVCVCARLPALSIWVCSVFHCCPVCQWSPHFSEHLSYCCRIHLQFKPGGMTFCLTRWQSVERSKVQPHFTFLSKRQQVLLPAVFNSEATLHNDLLWSRHLWMSRTENI